MIDLAKSVRCAGLISACYATPNTLEAYQAIDALGFGYKLRDVILADELGFIGVPVGILVEDLETEELVEIYRGTRVIANGPNEWKVDAEFSLIPCPFVPGARTEKGFTSTEETFRLASGRPFPLVQTIAGHSLAAAWALLRAVKYKMNLISFAGPRVGDKNFSEAAVQAIPELIRWVNDPDIVPKVPFNVWPLWEYIHAGPAHELDSAGKVPNTVEAWHSIETYWHLIDPAHPLPVAS